MEEAIFAGGCFWCTEAIFSRLQGVVSVTPGYTGGTITSPTYNQVSSGSTNHAEAIKVIFDSSIISYKTLLEVFFATHDPTTLNKQGADVGTQYRSEVFYLNEKQKNEAETYIQDLITADTFTQIVTQITPAHTFYPAEAYHKDYYRKNSYQPYCQIVIEPKIQKLLAQYKTITNTSK